MLGPGAQHVCQTFVAKAAQNSRKSKSQLRSSTCEPEVGGRDRIYTQAHCIRKAAQVWAGDAWPVSRRLTGAGLARLSTRFNDAEHRRECKNVEKDTTRLRELEADREKVVKNSAFVTG